jgi:hypothetical protein
MHDTDAYSISPAEAVAEAAIAVGNGCPGGQCAIASWILCELLRMRGADPVFVLGSFRHGGGELEDHAWVEVDGMIVDATASQFGLPEVLVVGAGDERYVPSAKGRGAYLEVAELFPPDQRLTPQNVARLREAMPGMHACRSQERERDTMPSQGFI